MSQFKFKRDSSYKVVNKQISIFNETLLIIRTSFSPQETKIFNERKPPGADAGPATAATAANAAPRNS